MTAFIRLPHFCERHRIRNRCSSPEYPNGRKPLITKVETLSLVDDRSLSFDRHRPSELHLQIRPFPISHPPPRRPFHLMSALLFSSNGIHIVLDVHLFNMHFTHKLSQETAKNCGLFVGDFFTFQNISENCSSFIRIKTQK